MAQGHRNRPEHFISLIDKVTRDDLNRIGAKMLGSKVSLAAIGDLKKLPKFNDIELGLLDKEVSYPKIPIGYCSAAPHNLHDDVSK